MAYRKFSNDYVADEEKARASKFGLWANKFTPPWDWRKMMREKWCWTSDQKNEDLSFLASDHKSVAHPQRRADRRGEAGLSAVPAVNSRAHFAAYQVSTRVDSVKNNDEACIEPA